MITKINKDISLDETYKDHCGVELKEIENRVAVIKEQISSGTYCVDNLKLAKSILENIIDIL